MSFLYMAINVIGYIMVLYCHLFRNPLLHYLAMKGTLVVQQKTWLLMQGCGYWLQKEITAVPTAIAQVCLPLA